MPGAQLQLVSYGAQDMYLTGNPQITFFKVVYRRHTNFSMEDVIIAASSINNPLLGGTYTSIIPRSGDLLHKLSLIIRGNKTYQNNFLGNPSTAIINNVALSIDSHQVDRQYGEWIETWFELTKPNPNGTCSNITNINENSISHLSTAMDLATTHYDLHQRNIDKINNTYYNARLNKLTNIMGTGASYPPTLMQKTSNCGGCFCTPTYLQEIADQSYGTTSGTPGQNSSFVDFAVTVDSLIGQNGSFTLTGGFNTSYSSGSNTLYESNNASQAGGSILGTSTIDIPFWFSKDPGLSIPIIALQTSQIQFSVTFSSKDDAHWSEDTLGDTIFTHNGPASNINNCLNAHKATDIGPLYNTGSSAFNLIVDISALYIYLDTDERRRFAQVSHEYLIEQVQSIRNVGGGTTSVLKNIDISQFTHPVKELIWIGSPYKRSNIEIVNSSSNDDKYAQLNNGQMAHKSGVRFQRGDDSSILGGKLDSTNSVAFGNASLSRTDSPTTTGKQVLDTTPGMFVTGLLGPSTPSCLDNCKWTLTFNDVRRLEPMDLQYYTRTQVERYHTGYGSVSCPDSIAVYSFALKPEDHQPSGSCNFSKIDNILLQRYVGSDGGDSHLRPINVYAVNYNILRIMGGLASLAYNI